MNAVSDHITYPQSRLWPASAGLQYQFWGAGTPVKRRQQGLETGEGLPETEYLTD